MLWACLVAFRIRVWANTAGSTHFSRCAHQQAVSSLTWNLRAAARSPITGAQARTFSFVSELWFRAALAAYFTALDSTLIVRHHPWMHLQFSSRNRRSPVYRGRACCAAESIARYLARSCSSEQISSIGRKFNSYRDNRRNQTIQERMAGT